MKSAGKVVETGTLPDGREYRVWRAYGSGRQRVFVGDRQRVTGRGTCHNVAWLRQVQREGRLRRPDDVRCGCCGVRCAREAVDKESLCAGCWPVVEGT